ncbi:tyrosine-type recombinase/integrase [Nitrospira sp. Nam74]
MGQLTPVRGVFSRSARGQEQWWARIAVPNAGTQDGRKLFGPFESVKKANDFVMGTFKERTTGSFAHEAFSRRGQRRLLADLIAADFEKTKGTPDHRNQVAYSKWWTAHYSDLLVKQFTHETIIEAMDTLEEEKELAPQTVFHYLKYMRRIVRAEFNAGHLPRNPFLHPDVHLPSPGVGKAPYLSFKDEPRLMAALGEPYADWARFAIWTGLRRTEQFTLPWANVDLERGIITLENTKGGKLRGDARSVEYANLDTNAVELLRTFSSWQTSKWVFPAQRNSAVPLDTHNFYNRVWLPAVKKAGLTGLTWHTLRHTFASRLAMKGKPMEDIRVALRHSNILMVTKRYVHLQNAHMKSMLAELSNYNLPE